MLSYKPMEGNERPRVTFESDWRPAAPTAAVPLKQGPSLGSAIGLMGLALMCGIVFFLLKKGREARVEAPPGYHLIDTSAAPPRLDRPYSP